MRQIVSGVSGEAQRRSAVLLLSSCQGREGRVGEAGGEEGGESELRQIVRRPLRVSGRGREREREGREEGGRGRCVC